MDRCSFCQKSLHDVRMLIAGPAVHICDECVDVCGDILRRSAGGANRADVADGAFAKDLPQVGVSGPAVRCALCRMPAPVEDAVLIRDRGVLCPGCIGEIEAILAERQGGDL